MTVGIAVGTGLILGAALATQLSRLEREFLALTGAALVLGMPLIMSTGQRSSRK